MNVDNLRLQMDMVFIGAGGAGPTAAVAALESGAEHIDVLEKAVS